MLCTKGRQKINKAAQFDFSRKMNMYLCLCSVKICEFQTKSNMIIKFHRPIMHEKTNKCLIEYEK